MKQRVLQMASFSCLLFDWPAVKSATLVFLWFCLAVGARGLVSFTRYIFISGPTEKDDKLYDLQLLCGRCKNTSRPVSSFLRKDRPFDSLYHVPVSTYAFYSFHFCPIDSACCSKPAGRTTTTTTHTLTQQENVVVVR